MARKRRRLAIIGAITFLVPIVFVWATVVRPRSIWRSYGVTQTINGKPASVKTFQTKDRVYILDFSGGSGALYAVDIAHRQVFRTSKGCFTDIGIALVGHDLPFELGVEIKLDSAKTGWDPELKIGKSELSFIDFDGDKPMKHKLTGIRM